MANDVSLPVAVSIFLLNDKKQVLLIKRKNTSFMDGYWGLPGGRLQEGESISSACIREAKEEVGVNVLKDDLEGPLSINFSDGKKEKMYFVFLTKKWQSDPINLEEDKCEKIEWFHINGLPEKIIPHLPVALEYLLAGKNYLEYGFDQ
ncbi:MAG: NUDIX domain-containing protein [Candidatus Gracilibacteria bacterium]|nr:NUDIX domain-containing protein [Candidatus Gracilibacteria bacterium]